MQETLGTPQASRSLTDPTREALPYSVTYHLHPPVLRLGLKKKLPMGKPYELAFRALRRIKRLRGTPFDVFGWDRDRRAERAVIEEYEQLIGEGLAEQWLPVVVDRRGSPTLSGPDAQPRHSPPVGSGSAGHSRTFL